MPEPRTIFLQWKGTDACLDFECACGKDYHYDGYNFGGLRCAACGRCYRIDHDIPVTEVPEDDWWGRELNETHTDEDWEVIPVDVDRLTRKPADDD